jgi:hypothetical protein
MALNSSKIVPVLKPKNGRALVDEKIDERILRLLGLEGVFDIDYDTYASLLKERMGAARMRKQTLPTEEVELLTNEWKKIKGKKGRFKVKKITAESFKKGTAVGMNLGKQRALSGIKKLSLSPAIGKGETQDSFNEITSLLNEIVKNLTQQNKTQKDSNERERKEGENAKRALAESKLEKGFALAIKTAEKVVAPVKSMLRRIIDFFMAIFWGKVFLKLLDWFADPANKKKIDSLFRFFGDHWPKLLALYLRFGTGLGKFVGGLTKLVFFGARKLLQTVFQMVGAKGAAKFLGGKGGKLVATGLSVATTVGTTMALSEGIENFVGQGEDKQPKMPAFKGGGFANFKKLFGMFGGGSFNPGYVSGEKGVDKIPAMLTDGEFVMSRGAVEKYGVNTLEAMNAAGGGTNRPKIMGGKTYAQGGGLIGSLSRFLPGTGTVMAPQGMNLMYQNKLLGVNVGEVRLPLTQTYSQQDVERYNKDPKSPSTLVKFGYGPLANRHVSVPKTKTATQTSPSKPQPTPSLQQNTQGLAARLSSRSERQQSEINRLLGRNDKTMTWGESQKIIGEKYGMSTRGEQMKQLKQQGLLGGQKEPRYAQGGMVYSPKTINQMSLNLSTNQSKEPRYAQGGMVQSPMQLSKMPLRAKNITPPSAPPVLVSTTSKTSTTMPSIPSSPGVPKAPSFNSIHSNNERKRILAIHGVA